MQVEVDMKCMQTKFGGHGFSGFEDFATFQTCMAKIPFWTMDYSPWGSKNRIGSQFSIILIHRKTSLFYDFA